MALVFHELVTNAAKHGALADSVGGLSIDWTTSEAQLTLNWRESGGPTVALPRRRGFGTRLLSGALDNFDGKLEMAFEPSGLVCRIGLKLDEDLVLETGGLRPFPGP